MSEQEMRPTDMGDIIKDLHYGHQNGRSLIRQLKRSILLSKMICDALSMLETKKEETKKENENTDIHQTDSLHEDLIAAGAFQAANEFVSEHWPKNRHIKGWEIT